MITAKVEAALNTVEKQIENLNQLLPGLPEEFADDFLMQIHTAAATLEEAHNYITGESQ